MSFLTEEIARLEDLLRELTTRVEQVEDWPLFNDWLIEQEQLKQREQDQKDEKWYNSLTEAQKRGVKDAG